MHPANFARHAVRILIVDDAPAVRESLRWLLEDEPGLTVIGEAPTGSLALQMAVNLKPDLVILDVELPDMDGFVVTSQLKAQPRSLVGCAAFHAQQCPISKTRQRCRL
jgi:DNA-binding NarL/FixJ family response regulator